MITNVFKLAVINRKTEQGGLANAILLDPLRGIFVTVAHAVYAAGALRNTEHYIRLPHSGKDYRAEHKEKWTNWNADLAYLRIPPEKLSEYSRPLFTTNEQEDRKLKIIGFSIDEYETPEETEALVISWKHNYGVSMPSKEKTDWARNKWLPLHNKDKRLLYENYIWLHSLAETTSKDNPLSPGKSGSPVLTDQNEIAGIISSAISSGGKVLAVPSTEFNFKW